MRLLLAVAFFLVPIYSQQCSDILDVKICEAMKPMCIGSIIVAQMKDLAKIAEKLENTSTVPVLESSLPLMKSSNGLTEEQNTTLVESLENTLPILKESFPLIRESFPLIRQIFDPIYSVGDVSACQKKASCKRCRECPQLREAVTNLVKSLCPSTCRLCDDVDDVIDSATQLAALYV